MMKPVSITQGDSPILLAQPHSGVFVPDHIFADLNELGRQLIDTDWHIPELYDGLADGATVVRANFNRYVIDANRDPEGQSLYPGQNTTGLVPLSTFDGQPIWSKQPTEQDIEQRLAIYHNAYHEALKNEIERVKARHGVVVLYDCHSIRSDISYLFSGQLPELNIGTNSGRSCSAQLQSVVESACANSAEFSYVLNGRFKGGWTTRHYGRPELGVHAIQMELAQRTYLKQEVPPFNYDQPNAKRLRQTLRTIFCDITNSLKSDFLMENNHEQTS